MMHHVISVVGDTLPISQTSKILISLLRNDKYHDFSRFNITSSASIDKKLSISIEFDDIDYLTKSAPKAIFIINSYLHKYNMYSMDSLRIDWPPRFPISHPLITLTITKDYTSLKDIHKYILHCGTLTIRYIGLVERNVLGLFQMKGVHNIVFQDLPKKEGLESWVKIVTEELKSSKDILNCQEKLLEAGLKDYAKL